MATVKLERASRARVFKISSHPPDHYRTKPRTDVGRADYRVHAYLCTYNKMLYQKPRQHSMSLVKKTTVTHDKTKIFR